MENFKAAQCGRKESNMYIPKKIMDDIISHIHEDELTLEAQTAVAEIKATVRQAKEESSFLFEDLDNYRAFTAWTGVEDVLNVMEDVDGLDALSEEEYQEIAEEAAEQVDWQSYAFIDQSAGNEAILEVVESILKRRGIADAD